MYSSVILKVLVIKGVSTNYNVIYLFLNTPRLQRELTDRMMKIYIDIKCYF